MGNVLKPQSIKQRLVDPVANLLRQGITPEKIAAAIAAGVVLGLFPVLGTTTILCALAAAWLGLNLPLIQLVNAVVYPFQILLLIPMLEWGQSLFGQPRLPLTLEKLTAMVRASAWQTITALGGATLRAIAVWILASCVVAPAIYFILVPALRFAGKARSAEGAKA